MITNKTARDFIIAKKLFPGGGSVIETDTATGSVVNFETNMAASIVKCVCDINPSQDGTSVLNVTRTKTNVWDEVTEEGTYDTTTGEAVSVSGQLRSKKILVTSNTTFYCFKGGGGNLWVLFYDVNHEVIEGYYTGNSHSGNASNISNTSFTTPPQCYEMAFYLTSGYGSTYNNDVSLNYPSTDTSYHAYTGSTYTIPLGRTVYGGSVDIIAGTGKILDDHGDLVDITFTAVTLSTLEGINNIWVDTGDIEVTYKYKAGQGVIDKRQFLPLIYGKKHYRKEY